MFWMSNAVFRGHDTCRGTLCVYRLEAAQFSSVSCVETSQYLSTRLTNCCFNITPNFSATGGCSLMIEIIAPGQVSLFGVTLLKYVLLTVKSLNTVSVGFRREAQMDKRFLRPFRNMLQWEKWIVQICGRFALP